MRAAVSNPRRSDEPCLVAHDARDWSHSQHCRGRLAAGALALCFAGTAVAFDLQVSSFTDTPDPAVAGGQYTYSVDITNSSVDDAPASELTVTLDANLNVSGALPAGCAFEPAPRLVRCAIPLLGFNATTTRAFAVRYVGPGVVVAASTATVSDPGGDTSLPNNTSTQNTTINLGADLALTKSATSPVAQGGQVTFTIGVTNNGPNVATGGIRVLDTLPANLAFVSGSGGGWICSSVGQNVTCLNPADIAVGAAASALQIVAQLAPGIATGTVTNSATTDLLNPLVGDGDPNNNTNSATFTVAPGADLSVGKSVAPNPVVSGQPVTFTLTPRNNAGSTAVTVTLTDTLPAGFTGIAANGTGWSCGVAGQTVTCTRAAYAVGATDNVTINATAPTVITLQSFSNTANITSTTPDTTPGNNTSPAVNFNVQPDGADLSIAKTKTPNPVAQGSPITSAIVVTNLGPQAVPAGGTITVTETGGAGETLVSASGGGWTCLPPAGNAITCTRPGPLALNAAAPAITVTSTATAAGTLTNTTNVALSGPVADAVPGNNSASASTISTATIADLTIAKSVDIANLSTAQNTLTYTLTVTNNGPGISTNVTLTDPVPMFTTSPLHGTTGIVATPTLGNCSVNPGDGTVTCNVGTLTSGTSATITVTVSRPMRDGPFTNTASVTSPDIGDQTPGNNSAQASTTVAPVTDAEMTSKSATPANPRAGTNSTYVLNFRNDGPSIANAVTVQDVFTVPGGDSGFTVISTGCSKAGCTCSFTAGVPALSFGSFNCTVGSMASAETASATFVIRPNFQTGNPVRTFTNTATIATTTVENNAANNAKSASLSVQPALIDLVVNKIDLVDPVGFDTSANTFIDYVISVNNGGPSYATGIQVTDAMTTAAGRQLEFVGLQATTCSVPAAPTCAGGGTTFTGARSFVCGAFELAATASCTLALRFRVNDLPPITGDIYNNVGSAAANEPDSIAINSTESESTTVRVRSDLQAVSKTATINPANLNEPFNWTIVVRNNGPGDSELTTVSDTLPAGMEILAGPPTFVKTVPAGNGNCTAAGNAITCAMGELDNGATATITVPVRVTAFPAGGTTTNTVSVVTNQVDFNAANNAVNGTVTVRKSSIAGSVYNDANVNGAFNAGEGIAGVALALSGTDLYGNAISRALSTAADGSWTFDNLPPSGPLGYQIVETQPALFFDSKEVAGSSGGTVPAACPPPGNCGSGAAQNTIGSIVLASNTAATGYLFEEFAAATVSGFVYHDINNNGQHEGGETGIAGVTIALTGTDYAGNPVSLSAVTDGSGQYTFTGNVPRSDAGGYTITETVEPAGFLDGRDQNGAGAGNVIANSAGRPAPETITLTQAQVLPGSSLTERNFGEIQTSTLSGAVYADENGNGTRDPTETVGIPGVVVTITGTNDIGQAMNCSVTTSGSGTYTFPNPADANPVCRSLRPGASYTITETKPAGLTSTGAQVGTVNGTPSGGLPGSTPTTQFVPGIVITSSGSTAINYNFGHQGTLLAGSVYVDTNNNGIRESGEPGIPGVNVTLSGNTAGAINVCTVYTCTVTTDASGNYSFANVPGSDAAGYAIRETGPSPGFAPSPILSNYVDGTDRAGTVNGVTTGTAGNDIITGVVIAIGQIGASYNFGERGQALSGSVYGDNNNDGLRQAGEPGLPGVTITLTGLTTTGVNVCTVIPSCTVVTDASGNYSFDNLPAGTYTLTEPTQPVGYLDGTDTAGSIGGTAGNDTITGIPLAAIGPSGTGYNFGEQTAKIRGSVYQDANGNGVRDGGEVGIAGVTITLTGTDNLGNPVNRTVLTDASGNYLFDGLRQGTYSVAETQPVIYIDGLDRVGSAGGTLGNDLITGIVLGPGIDAINYQFGEQVLTNATVSGRVWLDANHDRNDNDGTGSGRANWIAELVRGGTVVQSARTNANGDYTFTNVAPNTGYEIRFRNPANNAEFGNPKVDPGNLVPGSAVTNGTINNLTIISGANVIGQNLPLDPNGVVYQSITRLPVAGATVTLSGPAGFDPATQLLGGTGNVSQSVGADGYYQYILLPSAPAGTYRLAVTAPPGLLPAPSALIAPCSNALGVGAAPDPALVQTSNTAPGTGTPPHNPAACPATSATLASGAGTTQYYLSFLFTPGVSANLVNNHIALDPVLGGAIMVQKSTPLVNVTRGDLVPYTITATNTLGVTLPNIDLRDQVPPGFRYRAGSANLNGVPLEPVSSGRNLLWSNLTFAPNERKTFRMILVVGTGVGEGQYVNQAWAVNNIANLPVSNVATAAVRVVPDPTFDCTDVIGIAFDDRNANGYQDPGERGIPNVRIATARGLLVTTDAEGRYHVACAVVPDPDRGSNFVMKLDVRTLPSGYRMTTENPRDVRATRGKMVRLDFGATVHRLVRIEVAGTAFEPQSEALLPEWRARFASLPESLKAAPSVVLLSYRASGDPDELVARRIKALAQALGGLWREKDGGYRLVIETEVVR